MAYVCTFNLYVHIQNILIIFLNGIKCNHLSFRFLAFLETEQMLIGNVGDNF